MKGVSTVIAVILILMITVAMAALAYVWFTGVLGGLIQVGNVQTNRTITGLTSSFLIESTSDNQIYVRNTGESELSDFSVYINDVLVNVSSQPLSIGPDEVGTIAVSSYLGNKENTLKVTTGQGVTAVKSDFGAIFYDNFNDGNDNLWSRTVNPNNIAVVNGEYKFDTIATSRIDDANFSDFTFEYKMKHDAPGSWGGSQIRSPSGYAIVLNPSDTSTTRLWFYDTTNGTQICVPDYCAINIPVNSYTAFATVRIEAFGNNIKVFVNNVKYVDYTDTTSPSLSGFLVFYRSQTGGRYSYFDDVKVK